MVDHAKPSHTGKSVASKANGSEDMKMAMQEHIRPLVAPIVKQSGLELDDVQIVGPPAQPIVRVSVDIPLEVFRDQQGGGRVSVSSDQLSEVTRNILDVLDKDDPIDTPYTLEVSTPGAERELRHIHQWVRQVGYMIDIRFKDKTSLTGKLVEVEGPGQHGEGTFVTLSVDGKPMRIDLDMIRRAHARVQLTSDHQDDNQSTEDDYSLTAHGAVEE